MRLEVIARSLRKVARERSRDALADYLNALPAWDGVARLDHWAVDALGCDDTEYTRAAGANWIKALAARGLQAGQDVHECYILEGLQGIGKTRALRALGGPFYVEITAPIGSNDFMRELRGAWLADLAELSQIKRGSVEVVKQILSRNEDRYVEKYEREARSYLRRCVFAGSTNEGTYLADTTGNRRFIPLKCGQVRPELIEANRDQYFAEALHRVSAGERWYELPASAAAQVEVEREARRMLDPWEELFQVYLEGRAETWAGDLFANCLHTLGRERTGADEQRVGRVLRSLGWHRVSNRQRRQGALVYVWRPAQTQGGGTGGTGGTR
jgi:predicted P-loop ATPase